MDVHYRVNTGGHPGELVLFFLNNGIREAKWLTEEEKLVLERNIESDAGGKKKSPHSLGGVLKDHRVWTMSAIYFCFVMGQYGLTFWMPTLVKATGVKGNFITGLLSAIPVPGSGRCDDLVWTECR